MKEYDDLYRVNERAVFMILRASMIQMLKQGSPGSIVKYRVLDGPTTL